MHRLFTHRGLGGMLTILLLLAIVLPAQAAPARLDPRLVEYLAAAPGGQGSFLVFLQDQADLSLAPGIADRTARVTYVYETLRATAERSQAALRADLAAWGVPYRPFFIVNAIRVTGDLALARKLAARPEVARLAADPPLSGLDDPPPGPAGPPAVNGVEWNVARVHAPEVWALGYTGQGIVVGSVDTGVDWDHPALVNQYRPQIPGAPSRHDYNWAEPDGTSTEPYDPNGHGTHTTGTMVGDDGGTNQVGIAPGAQWIACKVDSNGVWQASKYIACWEWMMAPTDLNGQNPRPDLAAHVVNNSWSCPESEGCTPDTLLPAAQALYAAGIALAKSAGNSGSACSTITNPGQYYELLATAAFNSSDTIAGFSSRGPANYGGETRLKPDIAAPGVGVRSAWTGGGYSSASGTSMASPHTAGVIALLWSAQPALVGNLEKTYRVIKLTAEPKIDAQCPPYVDHPNDVWGWGIINALAAAQSGELRGTVTDDALAPLPGSVVAVEPIGGGDVRQTTADANAVYSFTLPAGDYVITATHPGFLPWSGTVSVAAGLTTTYDIVLQPLPPCEPVHDVGFTWHPLTPTLGQQVNFTGTATGTLPITYTWNWGDGTSSLVPCPLPPGTCSLTHTYPLPGVYTVALTATNCATATATAAHTVTVLGVPRIALPPMLPPVALNPGQQAYNSFTVANTGTADLDWGLAEVPDAPWLAVAPVSGTLAPGASSDVLLTYTAPITPAVYTTTLHITSNDPLSPAVDLTVEMEVVTRCVPVEQADFSWIPAAPLRNQEVHFSGWVTVGWISPTVVDSGVHVTWEPWSGAPHGGPGGGYPSLALDGAGRPHVSYASGPGSELRYAAFDGTSWQTTTVDPATSSYTALGIDSAGHAHIAYTDGAVKYATFDGTAWTTATVDGSGWGTALALDAADVPHLAYVSLESPYDLRYATFGGAGWQTATVENAGDVEFVDLAVDPTGRPRIAYHLGYPAHDLLYASFDGTAWVSESVDSDGNTGLIPSLGIDAAGHPHIAYCRIDEASGYCTDLRYATFDGAAWQVTTLERAPALSWISLVLDAAGRPVILYASPLTEEVRSAWFDGAGWHIAPTGLPWNIGYISTAMDTPGYLHIAYTDWPAGTVAYAATAQVLPTPPFTFTWDLGDGTAATGQEISHAYAAAGAYSVTLTVANACGQADATHAVPVRWGIYLPLVIKGSGR